MAASFERVQALFEASLERPQDERLAFLQAECGGDEALRDEVRELLVADAQAEAMLDRPAAAMPEPEPETDPVLAPGTEIGGYLVEQQLGHGGFGRVYRAVHPVIGKSAAIKVLYSRFSASPEHAKRFVNEARAVNEIHHPDIIDIFAFGETPEGGLYFVMDLVEGPTLQSLLRERGRLPLPEALPLLRRLAAAVDAAHACGVVHRDLKPANVIVQTGADGGLRPTLLDFGIAKLRLTTGSPARAGDSRESIEGGQVMGTPHYMSPEQASGEPVDARADVYAFGVIVYRMLTGRLPFEHGDAFELLMAHASEEPARPSTHAAELTAQVDAAVLSMLAKSPAARPSTLGAAVQALEAGSPTASPPTARAPQPPRRLPARLVAAVAIAAVGGLGWLALRDREHGPPRTAPRPETPVSASVSAPAAAPDSPVAVATPGPAAPERPPGPAEVTLELVQAPEGTEVLDEDGRVVGTAPGSIALPRSDDPVTLTFRHEGHEPLRMAVVPDADRRLPVVLRPAPKRPRRTLNPDLESPFR